MSHPLFLALFRYDCLDGNLSLVRIWGMCATLSSESDMMCHVTYKYDNFFHASKGCRSMDGVQEPTTYLQFLLREYYLNRALLSSCPSCHQTLLPLFNICHSSEGERGMSVCVLNCCIILLQLIWQAFAQFLLSHPDRHPKRV